MRLRYRSTIRDFSYRTMTIQRDYRSFDTFCQARIDPTYHRFGETDEERQTPDPMVPVGTQPPTGSSRGICMHRQIMDTPDHLVCDHVNHGDFASLNLSGEKVGA